MSKDKKVAQLMQDVFDVSDIDPKGVYFDKVSRAELRAQLSDMHMIIDVNTELYPIQSGQRLTVSFMSQLFEPEPETFDQLMTNFNTKSSHFDEFDYIMHGLVYKFKDIAEGKRQLGQVFISFGGLQCVLTGTPDRLAPFTVDTNVYILMRKLV